MTFRDALKRYQTYNPETGQFDVVRNIRQYANALDVNRVLLAPALRGKYATSYPLLIGLLRFTKQAPEIMALIDQEEGSHADHTG